MGRIVYSLIAVVCAKNRTTTGVDIQRAKEGEATPQSDKDWHTSGQ